VTEASAGHPLANRKAFRKDLRLVDWQRAAVDAWIAGDTEGPHRGTLEIFTGGGKSLIAIECMRHASEHSSGVRIVIVVPTLALLRQWRRVLLENTDLEEGDVGELHGHRKDNLADVPVLISVLNTASDRLPEMIRAADLPVMLVVDESHRAGAPQFSRVLQSSAQYTLGLSATAARDDVDDEGAPIDYDDHVLGVRLGRIVYRFDLRMAREVGWLPNFTVFHHAVHLTEAERHRYDEITRKIDDLADGLTHEGVDISGARSRVGIPGAIGELARAYVGAVALRKDLLYRAAQREKVVLRIIDQMAAEQSEPRALVFHERIDETVALYDALAKGGLPFKVGLEHSRLPESERREALNAFATGTVAVLVSVKSLVEGIDVPDADVGISVASSSSVRQRIQALGRVLRRRFDGQVKDAKMHILYVADTVDELIYEKEDWGDLTGEAANVYLDWPLNAVTFTLLEGPPRRPRPTEDQFWAALGGKLGEDPIEWPCEWPKSEWRVDSEGNVTNLEGRLVVNAVGVAESVRALKPTGGRFRISQKFGLIVVPVVSAGQMIPWVVGQIPEPFRLLELAASGEPPSNDEAGREGSRESEFAGPLDKAGGAYQIRQTRGGVIARRGRGGREFAATDPAGGVRADNARRVLAAWRQSGRPGTKFFINREGDAYYLQGGVPRLLAHVPEGFDWPDGDEGARHG
jgi:superfamily II DNA or RNA helicase